MKKLFLLLILSFFSAQSFAGSCPDGSDPIKSISADGTYFVYKCGNDTNNEIVQESSLRLSNDVQIFSAPDITDYTLDIVKEWHKIGSDAWGSYGPIEIYIIGNNKSDAKKLEQDFCNRHIQLDSGWNKKWDCANDNYQIFTQYVDEGGAAVSTYKKSHLSYDFDTLIMSSKRPSPSEEDYKIVILHEYFHIHQHANISGKCSDDSRIPCERDKKATGEYEKRPWFHEGGAEYRAQLLYHQSPDGRGSLKQRMQRKLDRSISDYKQKFNMDLKNLTYKKGKNVAYDIGAWFVAYLIYHEGEDKHRVNFYNDLDELGFEGSFKKNFGKSSDNYIKEFNEFIIQPQSKIIGIVP
jgi:hypothetical protein